jgi:hypothetical protein
MQVEFTREGGIAYFPGLSQPVTIDTAALPEEEAEELQQLIREADFYELPDRINVPRSRGADYQTYTIRVDAGDTHHVVRLSEPIEDEKLRALVTFLRRKAQEIRGSQ